MSGEGWTACGRGVRGEWCVRPSGHDGDCDPTLRMEPPAEPWRFDVPEVPAHVTAIKDIDGDVWLRLAGRKWSAVSWPGDSRSFADLIDYAPLVECEDPRAAS